MTATTVFDFAALRELAIAFLAEHAEIDGSGQMWHHELEKALEADLTATIRVVRKMKADGDLVYAQYCEGMFYYRLATERLPSHTGGEYARFHDTLYNPNGTSGGML